MAFDVGKRTALVVQGAQPFAHAMSKTLPKCALAFFASALIFQFSRSEPVRIFVAVTNLTDAHSLVDWFPSQLEKRMTATDHYRDQIKRATERMAQLHAKELLATQRRESKARETARLEMRRRREQVADLVFCVGAEALDDAELVGALLQHMDARGDSVAQENTRLLGACRLQNRSN